MFTIYSRNKSLVIISNSGYLRLMNFEMLTEKFNKTAILVKQMKVNLI